MTNMGHATRTLPPQTLWPTIVSPGAHVSAMTGSLAPLCTSVTLLTHAHRFSWYRGSLRHEGRDSNIYCSTRGVVLSACERNACDGVFLYVKASRIDLPLHTSSGHNHSTQ